MNEEINRLIEMYIKNIYEYDKDFTEQTIYDKQEELEQIAETDTVNSANYSRPYPNVIQQIRITNPNFEVKETERSGIYTVDIEVRTLIDSYDGDSAEVNYTETVRVERTIKSDYFISSLSSDTQTIYATYEEREQETVLRKSEDAYYELMIGNINLNNI
ncbi:MAG: hypothetical protein L0L95_06865 [Staphylococcus equorum]|nr:hypothetical protein [Staphylococcus equorum]